MSTTLGPSVFSGDEVKYPSPPTVSDEEGTKPVLLNNYVDRKEEIGSKSSSRSLFIVRHGERIDYLFGEWVPHCFDNKGNYIRRDLNMPISLPKRQNGPQGYLVDSPLTNIGLFQATTVGKELRNRKTNIKYIYTSPAFRSVQTAEAILQELENSDELKIRIEPGLFEMPLWYKGHTLEWMSPKELAESGYKIDVDYNPIFSIEEIVNNLEEGYEEYYSRGFVISNAVWENNPYGNILLVGHSSTVEICSRQLTGQIARKPQEMMDVITKIPYLGMAQLDCINDKWQMVEPCLPLTHGKNLRHDWKRMLN